MIEIPLTRGKVAIVDDCDAHLAAFKWHVRRSGRVWYAQRRVSRDGGMTTVLLHREVVAARPGIEIDHVNGDGLDCRRENLRPATAQQNQANRGPRADNRSGFKGVHWHVRDRAWVASLMFGRRRLSLGNFQAPEDAARAYDAAASRLFGAFARLNFPAEQGNGGSMEFKVGDVVEWTSQAAGTVRMKRGEVIEVVPPGRDPKTPLHNAGGWRRGESYVVRAVALGRKSRARDATYWPRVSALRPVPAPAPGEEGR